MISSAIKPYPIEPIAAMAVDSVLAKALLESVAEYLPRLQGRRIWLACSGGRDSLALAALCVQLYHHGKLSFLPQLLHVNHGLQVDSRYWAEHVFQWANIQHLPCTILQVQVEGSDEQAARQARYQAMLSYINQNDVLLLAHHADDQAETVLMRLIQGAGVKGLSGMQTWRVQVQGARQNVLWRPWLSVRRMTISNYAQSLQLPYIDDPTNETGTNVRSSLRRDVLPALSIYNENVIKNIARSAQLLSDAQATVHDQTAHDLQQVAIESLSYPSVQRVLDIDKVHKLPLHRQRQLMHYWLSQDEPLPPSKQLVDDMLCLTERCNNDHQTQLDWYAKDQRYSIYRYRQQLYRLSHSWLDWLTLPLIEQTQMLPNKALSQTYQCEKETLKFTVRANERYRWQLHIKLDELATLLIHDVHEINNDSEITLRVAPLGRKQRLQTALASRPQSGKKLYQTLSIPVWLRDSLLVVSAVSTKSTNPEPINLTVIDEDHEQCEQPLLLLSPFDYWILKPNNRKAAITNSDLKELIKSSLLL